MLSNCLDQSLYQTIGNKEQDRTDANFQEQDLRVEMIILPDIILVGMWFRWEHFVQIEFCLALLILEAECDLKIKITHWYPLVLSLLVGGKSDQIPLFLIEGVLKHKLTVFN